MTVKIGSFIRSNYYQTSFGIPITQYRSPTTGLLITFIDVDVPIVNGFFTIATEEADELIDSGLPHTLEHLTFLGSEDFPYKGVLDTLANRSRAVGTNAWTAVDNTTYTITTAGSSGFAKIMPIYIDHILYPSLTDSGFVTEVYHVNGKGIDGGVVYSEMQGRQNGPEDLAWHRMHQLTYPAPSGYSSETGGLMHKLRQLNINKIRQYHSRYYRPDNLCLIVTGKVDQQKILAQLEPTEAKIISKGVLPKVDRPWVNSPIPALQQSVNEIVSFPSDDESTGNLIITFRGPSVREAFECAKLDILLMYLTDSSVSLLERTFVECEEPLATSVSEYSNRYKETSAVLYFSGVPTEHLKSLAPQVMETLANHTIDMNRMHSVIHLRRLRILQAIESDPGKFMASAVISYFLYGIHDNVEDLRDFTDEEHFFHQFLQITQDQWQSLLSTALVNSPRVIIQAKPSAQLAKDITAAEAARVAERQNDPAMLKHHQEILDAAIKANDMPIPPEIISRYEVPPLDIKFPTVTSAQLPRSRFANKLQDEADNINVKLPFYVELDNVQSPFMGLRLVIDTVDVPAHLRLYLNLWLELIFSSPIQLDNGTLLTYEDVVAGLNDDTVDFHAGCGAIHGCSGSSFMGGVFESQISLSMQATPEKYSKAVEWMCKIIKHIQWDYSRMSTIIKNMLGDVPQYKRDAGSMAWWNITTTIFDVASSNHAATAMPVQVRFLTELIKRVDNKDPSIVNDLTSLHTNLFQPQNIRLHVTGPITKMSVSNTLLVWKDFIMGTAQPTMTPAKPSREFLNEIGQNLNSNNGLAKLINIPSNESGFLYIISRGPNSNEHKDYAAVLVTFEYFDTMEGPFWKNIRGPGLAYSASLSCNPLSSLVQLTIYRAAQVVEAYQSASNIVKAFISDPSSIDKDLFEAAKAALTYTVVSREKTPRNAATQVFLTNTLQHSTSTRYNQWLLDQINAVTIDDMIRVAKEYLANLFDPNSSLFIGVTGPSKLDDTYKGFDELGIKFDIIKVSDES